MTLKEFLDYFNDKYQINIRGIYTQSMEPIMNKKLIDKNIEDIFCIQKKMEKKSIRHLIQLYLDAKDDKKILSIYLPSFINLNKFN